MSPLFSGTFDRSSTSKRCVLRSLSPSARSSTLTETTRPYPRPVYDTYLASAGEYHDAALLPPPTCSTADDVSSKNVHLKFSFTISDSESVIRTQKKSRCLCFYIGSRRGGMDGGRRSGIGSCPESGWMPAVVLISISRSQYDMKKGRKEEGKKKRKKNTSLPILVSALSPTQPRLGLNSPSSSEFHIFFTLPAQQRSVP